MLGWASECKTEISWEKAFLSPMRASRRGALRGRLEANGPTNARACPHLSCARALGRAGRSGGRLRRYGPGGEGVTPSKRPFFHKIFVRPPLDHPNT